MLMVTAAAVVGLLVVAVRWPRAAVALLIPMPLLAVVRAPGFIYAAMVVAAVIAARPTRRTLSANRIPLALMVGLAVVTAVQFVLFDPERSAGGWLQLLAFESALLAGLAAVLVRPEPRFVLGCLAGTGTVYGGFALTEPALALDRATPVMGQNANGLGFLAAVGLVAALSLVVLDRSRVVALVASGAGVVCGLGILATSSVTSGAVALAGALVVAGLGVTGQPEQRRRLWLLGLGLVVPAIVLAVPLWQRFGGLSRDLAALQNSWSIRTSGTRAALEYFWSAPWPGAGLGRTGEAVHDAGITPYPLAPHNAFIGIASDLGVIALVLFLALAVMVAWRTWALRNRMLAATIVTYLIGTVAIEWPINPATAVGFWVAGGTVLAAAGLDAVGRHSPPDESASVGDTAGGLGRREDSRSDEAVVSERLGTSPRSGSGLH